MKRYSISIFNYSMLRFIKLKMKHNFTVVLVVLVFVSLHHLVSCVPDPLDDVVLSVAGSSERGFVVAVP
jgi:hypothetical protein